MTNTNLKFQVKVNELLFGLAYYPWLIAWLFTSTYFKDMIHPYGIIGIWRYVGLGLLFLKFALGNVRVKALFYVPLIILLGYIVSHDNGNASFVGYTLALIFSARDIDFRKLIRNTMICQICVVTLVVTSALIGIIPNEVTLSFAGGIVRNRYGLGFTFTTFTPNFLLSILLEYIYLKGEKKWTIIEFFVFTVLNIFVYRYTETRLSFFMVFVLLFIVFTRRFIHFKANFSILRPLMTVVYPLMAIISYLLSVLYYPGNQILSAINNTLSQRLRYGKQGLQMYPPSLFGQDIEWDTAATSYFYVDSSYINILISYGILVFLVVLVGYSIVMHRTLRNRDITLAIVLVFWSIRAGIDPQLFLLWFNPFLFLIARDFLSFKKEKVDDITHLRTQ